MFACKGWPFSKFSTRILILERDYVIFLRLSFVTKLSRYWASVYISYSKFCTRCKGKLVHWPGVGATNSWRLCQWRRSQRGGGAPATLRIAIFQKQVTLFTKSNDTLEFEWNTQPQCYLIQTSYFPSLLATLNVFVNNQFWALFDLWYDVIVLYSSFMHIT